VRVTGSKQVDKQLGRDLEQSPPAAPKASRELAMLPRRALCLDVCRDQSVQKGSVVTL